MPDHGRPYDEEERLYGPPLGTFDPEWVVRLVRERRPRIEWDLAYRLAGHAWRRLNASPQLGPADLAGYCALDEPAATESEVNDVIGAALDFCDAYEVEPPPAEVA